MTTDLMPEPVWLSWTALCVGGFVLMLLVLCVVIAAVWLTYDLVSTEIWIRRSQRERRRASKRLSEQEKADIVRHMAAKRHGD